MKKKLARAFAILAIALLGVTLPACETTEDGYTSTSVYVGVGYGVYGGYYGAGWGGCCYGPPAGGVIVRPPMPGPRPMPY
jgi:hypothetical protein